MDPNEFVTVEQFAKLHGCAPKTIRKLIAADGTIRPYRRPGQRCYVYALDDLDRLRWPRAVPIRPRRPRAG